MSVATDTQLNEGSSLGGHLNMSINSIVMKQRRWDLPFRGIPAEIREGIYLHYVQALIGPRYTFMQRILYLNKDNINQDQVHELGHDGRSRLSGRKGRRRHRLGFLRASHQVFTEMLPILYDNIEVHLRLRKVLPTEHTWVPPYHLFRHVVIDIPLLPSPNAVPVGYALVAGRVGHLFDFTADRFYDNLKSICICIHKYSEPGPMVLLARLEELAAWPKFQRGDIIVPLCAVSEPQRYTSFVLNQELRRLHASLGNKFQIAFKCLCHSDEFSTTMKELV
jgi:hypothetical protein